MSLLTCGVRIQKRHANGLFLTPWQLDLGIWAPQEDLRELLVDLPLLDDRASARLTLG